MTTRCIFGTVGVLILPSAERSLCRGMDPKGPAGVETERMYRVNKHPKRVPHVRACCGWPPFLPPSTSPPPSPSLPPSLSPPSPSHHTLHAPHSTLHPSPPGCCR
ncbi:hypothetical protein T484DRAFT_2967390 [Baffinella frigidus]|nr:hypothetical protein T484DRAFT_2967390 [Cryptophyta sp. CCMP2293]